jgi:hypothetical protein
VLALVRVGIKIVCERHVGVDGGGYNYYLI